MNAVLEYLIYRLFILSLIQGSAWITIMFSTKKSCNFSNRYRKVYLRETLFVEVSRRHNA